MVRENPTAFFSLYNTNWLRQVEPSWEEKVYRKASEMQVGTGSLLGPQRTGCHFTFLLDQHAGVRDLSQDDGTKGEDRGLPWAPSINHRDGHWAFVALSSTEPFGANSRFYNFCFMSCKQ